jgi:hypothetical protein
VEASIWTDRMLTALEEGVKGGVWFSLIDKVYAPANLLAAFKRAAKNKGAAGVDHVTIKDYQRWPNAYFTAHGYFSLEEARAALSQSPSG